MNTQIDLRKEIVFASSDSDISHQISKLTKQGVLKKIAPKLYTTNLVDSPENIVKRNLLSILMWRFPKMIISHRSANEMRVTASGHFFLTGTYNRVITDLPGITIHIFKGPSPDEKDMVYGQMFIASEYRWMLENMQQSRKQESESKVLPITVIERKLENVLISGGEEQLNLYRDTLRATAERLNMIDEFQEINLLISALLNTHSTDVLTSPTAKATAAGMPYDADRLQLFQNLFDLLQEQHFIHLPLDSCSEEDYRNVAFFESYFSNYIEGTEFSVDDAYTIVDTGLPIMNRNEDSHDILGTFQVVSNRREMNICPTSAQELIEILRFRHSLILAGRPDLNPGHFKDRNNRAGSTEFVDAQKVMGTLEAGFNLYAALTSPFAKAIYMMFMISEVHPFTDGNGRISRIMMNAEFSRAGESHIIVPTVYREDYLLSLRKLSRQSSPIPYIQAMKKLHRFSRTLYGRSFPDLLDYLKRCNAFEDANLAKLNFE